MTIECGECEHDLRTGHEEDCSRCPRCPGCGKPLIVEDEEVGYVCSQCLRPDAAPPKEVIEVVAAVRRDGDRYWVCRRTDDGSHGGLAGMWEYPGGKVEEGETHKETLRREMREEFSVSIEIGAQLDSIIATAPDYSDRTYRVSFFAVTFLVPPKLRCHDLAKWCTVAQLQQDKHFPSGKEFNRRLAAHTKEPPPPSDAAPVAWRYRDKAGGQGWLLTSSPVFFEPERYEVQPLYAHPEDAPGGPYVETDETCGNWVSANRVGKWPKCKLKSGHAGKCSATEDAPRPDKASQGSTDSGGERPEQVEDAPEGPWIDFRDLDPHLDGMTIGVTTRVIGGLFEGQKGKIVEVDYGTRKARFELDLNRLKGVET